MAGFVLAPLANPLLPKPSQFFCYRFGGELVKIYLSDDPNFAEAWFSLRVQDRRCTQYGLSVMKTIPDRSGAESMAVATDKEVLIFQFTGRRVKIDQMLELDARGDVRYVVFGKNEAVQLIFPPDIIRDHATRHYLEAKHLLDGHLNTYKNYSRLCHGQEYRPDIVLDNMEGQQQVFRKVCQLLRMDERQFVMPPVVSGGPWYGPRLCEEQAKYHAAKAWIGAKLGLFLLKGGTMPHPGPVGAPLPSLGGIVHVHSSTSLYS